MPNYTITEILTAIFRNRTVTSAEQVIDLLSAPPPRFSSTSADYDLDLDYTTMTDNFILHLKRYLRGSGVPKSSDGSSVFQETEHFKDPLARPKSFLKAITDNQFLPIDPSQRIRVSPKSHL